MFIFICYAVPYEMVNNNMAVSVPGNKQALLLAELFYNYYGSQFTCITIPPRKASLRDCFKKSIIKGHEIVGSANTVEVEYCNFPIIKEFSIRKNLRIKLCKLLENKADTNTIVMSVNSNGCISIPLFQLKNKFDFKTAIYLSDMPFDENPTNNFVKKLLIKHDNKIRLSNLLKYDSAITGVELLRELYFKNKPCVVIDPALEIDKYADLPLQASPLKNEINIVYTGSLNENYHIPELIEVIKQMPENYFITFYGRGPYTDLVIKEAATCSRIKYGGYLPFNDIVKVQLEADILIALLDTSKNISKYAVPSKVYDYLCTGVPVVSSDALSLPSVIKNFLTIVDDMNIEDIKKKIIEISSIPARIEETRMRAKMGKDYAIDNCKWDVQKNKINDYLRIISNE